MTSQRSATSAALDRSIERLGGEAAAPASPNTAATAAEQVSQSEGSVPQPAPSTADVEIGWLVWLGDPEGDMEYRKWGIVVDAAGTDSIVVLRSRKRQQRMEAWCEVWRLDALDLVNSYDPGSVKHVQAAKTACEAIAASKASGRWGDKDEELLAAVAVLTAPFSGGKRSA